MLCMEMQKTVELPKASLVNAVCSRSLHQTLAQSLVWPHSFPEGRFRLEHR
jgi:hypothetical protein